MAERDATDGEESEVSEGNSSKTRDTGYVIQKLLKVQRNISGRAEELEKKIQRDTSRLTRDEEFELITSKYVLVEHMKSVRESRQLRVELQNAIKEKSATSFHAQN